MGWKWHQLDNMQVICTLLQTDNHASTSSLNFYRPDALPYPSQQCQSTEGKKECHLVKQIGISSRSFPRCNMLCRVLRFRSNTWRGRSLRSCFAWRPKSSTSWPSGNETTWRGASNCSSEFQQTWWQFVCDRVGLMARDLMCGMLSFSLADFWNAVLSL